MWHQPITSVIHHVPHIQVYFQQIALAMFEVGPMSSYM